MLLLLIVHIGVTVATLSTASQRINETDSEGESNLCVTGVVCHTLLKKMELIFFPSILQQQH